VVGLRQMGSSTTFTLHAARLWRYLCTAFLTLRAALLAAEELEGGAGVAAGNCCAAHQRSRKTTAWAGASAAVPASLFLLLAYAKMKRRRRDGVAARAALAWRLEWEESCAFLPLHVTASPPLRRGGETAAWGTSPVGGQNGSAAFASPVLGASSAGMATRLHCLRLCCRAAAARLAHRNTCWRLGAKTKIDAFCRRHRQSEMRA